MTAPLRVVIAGGGVAGLETLMALRSLAEDRVTVDLVAPVEHFRYRPLAVAEPFGLGEPLRAPLEAIAAEHGARFRQDALSSVRGGEGVAVMRSGERLRYDALVVACGARTRDALPGSVTFTGAIGSRGIAPLLEEVERGRAREVAFAILDPVAWQLPLYELALLTASASAGRAAITLTTAETEPLELFGTSASRVVRGLLEERGIGLITGAQAVAFRDGHLELEPSARLAADAVVSLPRLEGPAIAGLPTVGTGFLPVDPHGQVPGVEAVYAAGDATAMPVKQGGIAAQQADAVAATIARLAGAPVEPKHRRFVLRGLLITGEEPRYLRAELGAAGESSVTSRDPIWWPPGKVAGRHLAPYMARIAGSDPSPPPPEDRELHEVRVELDPQSGAPPVG